MAVSIGQMDIELEETPAPSGGSSTDGKTEKPIDLEAALEMLRERKLRLKAD